MLVAKAMRLAQIRYQLLVVVAQLGEHVQGRDEIRIVVEDTLQAADLADRPHGRAADLADALGNVIGGGEDLVGLLVQEKMIVAEVRTRCANGSFSFSDRARTCRREEY